MTAEGIRLSPTDREAMAEFAARLAGVLRAGDVLLLTGNLGAGKTTFTQFLGRALDVRGRVSSPTFTIAREHPARSAGPGLVHVDAYRLSGADEFEDLGLESSLEDSVTVVEWGRGMAEALGDHLDIEILRTGALGEADARVAGEAAEAGAAHLAEAGEHDEAGDAPEDEALEDETPEDESRTVIIRAFGPTWEDRLPQLRALGGANGTSDPHGAAGDAREPSPAHATSAQGAPAQEGAVRDGPRREDPEQEAPTHRGSAQPEARAEGERR
ncbi:tRNA (adenosine(37)-N6)-threonylcarbamoyltransferase complex ATPase subunit type 1 TsaE [Brevibacterium album]|uniref:tRNA (adenosine(37)-N6)-threonylcarbamoyltransferase complex ATPase subunit type 1 TsaE n=1 Tax=Brevibacterium album TaxID=417948 RepID=UPI0003FE566F